MTDYIYQTICDNELKSLKQELKVDRELGHNRIRGTTENYDPVAPLVLVSNSKQHKLDLALKRKRMVKQNANYISVSPSRNTSEIRILKPDYQKSFQAFTNKEHVKLIEKNL